MKRKSILILAAVMMLIVSIPLFALAESETAVQPQDGTGNMYGRSVSQTDEDADTFQGNQYALLNCDGTQDCDCEAQGTGLGADGEALHRNARTESGQRMLLKNGSGTDCENFALGDNAQPAYQNRRDTSEGGKGRNR